MPLEKVYYWPQWFTKTLSKKERLAIDKKFIEKLGHGNIFLWRALNLYDDILDGDGPPEILPLANSYYRRWLEIYYRLGLPPDFYRLFNRLISDLDTANRRETRQDAAQNIKRLPRFGNLLLLSKKSLPLSCGPLAILASLGYKTNSQRTQATLEFFRAALAAKQLSDDSYDWREDLATGKITMANVLVLKAAAEDRKRPDMLSEPSAANIFFTDYAAPRLKKAISDLRRRAEDCAQSAQIDPDSRFVKEIIGPLKKAVRTADRFQRRDVSPS